jgi:hypothetical protein
MRLMLGRYLRLLEAAARQPELLLRKLLLIAGPRAAALVMRKLRGTFFTTSLQPFIPHRSY